MSCWSILITFQRRQIFERSRRGAVCSSLRFFSSETFSSDDENCLRKASTSWWKKAAIKRVNHRELKKAKRAEEAYLDMETATIVKSQRVWKCVRDARSAGSMNDRAESIFVNYHFSLPPRLSADRWRVIHKGCETSRFLGTTRPISLSRELSSFMLSTTSSAQLICTTFRKHRAHACSGLFTSWHTFSSLRKLILFSIRFSIYQARRTELKIAANTRSTEFKLIVENAQPIGGGVDGARKVEREIKRETSPVLSAARSLDDVGWELFFAAELSARIEIFANNENNFDVPIDLRFPITTKPFM